jgi:preprotein translocase subunit SecF
MIYIKKHPKISLLLLLIITIVIWDLYTGIDFQSCQFTQLDSRTDSQSSTVSQKEQDIYYINNQNLWRKLKSGQKISFHNRLNNTVHMTNQNNERICTVNPTQLASITIPDTPYVFVQAHNKNQSRKTFSSSF